MIDWEHILIAAIATIPGVVAAYLAYAAKQEAKAAKSIAKETGVKVDGRLTELLNLTRTAAADKATLAEASRGRDVAAALAAKPPRKSKE